MQETTSIYELAGGLDTFVELVDRFYDKVEEDDLLRPLYPDDLEPGKRHLALFFAQYWGGPQTYNDERGHPRLRRRHAPFAITPEAAVRWAQHMSDSIVELQLPEQAERAMLEYVVRFTPSMINHAG